jgi:triacylglycerol lipase
MGLEKIMPKPVPADTWNNLFYPPSDYRYFENSNQFDFEPGAHDFSWKNAWWLADAALLAYVKNWNAVKAALTTGARFDQVKAIGADDAKSTKGFFASRLGPMPFAVVAFRGTDRDDPRNAATDADTLTESRDGYIVHRGFCLALDQVWDDEVQPLLADFMGAKPGAAVYFTGHSLGAALATIAVTRFVGGGTCALYTVGSPRVGDDRFVRAVLEKTRQIFRFVNSQDIVTLIPPEVPLEHYYRHVGLEKYIDRTGVIHDHPSEFDKGIDVGKGIAQHDGIAALSAIGHPAQFLSKVLQGKPLVDPPPYIIGNHTPARYAIRIWNHYSGL